MESKSSESKRPSRKSLSDSVYEILLAQVVEGLREPGTPLNIDGLAREFNISQTPIREALARLEATGLVTRAALKGYRVARLFTARELEDLMDARKVIEPVNAYITTTRITSSVLQQLAETVETMKVSPRGGTFAEMNIFWAADEEFHRLIAKHTDNPFLLSAYNSLGGHIQRFRLFADVGITDGDSAIEEHSRIFRAVEKGDPELAQKEMLRHITKVKARANKDRKAFTERHGKDL